MAFDDSLMFYNARTISSEAVPAIVTVGKTPANGIGIELAVASASSQALLDVAVHASDSSTTGFITVAVFPQITSTAGIKYLVVQTKKKYLKLVGTPSGTSPVTVVTAGIVSGPSQGAHTA